MELVIDMLGYFLLFTATDVGRKEDSKIKLMEGKWWLIMGLILVGSLIIIHNHGGY
jgi:hypothetical protein